MNELEYDIEPPKGLISFNFPEIWRYRDLLYIFVWRDIKVRYKQTILGVAWAIFQPLVAMLIFTVFFGIFAKVPSDGAPYAIFVYVGLLYWNYFSTALTNASNCLIENEGIVKKVYFPRLLLPISTAVTPSIDFAFSLVVLAGLMFYYRYTPSLTGVLLVPFLLVISLLSASGLGLFLASLNAKFRDVRYVLPFFIQILMYITPVIYSVNLIPKKFQWIMYFNPMAGVISTSRSSLLGTTATDYHLLFGALLVSIIFFILGLTYFRKTERFIADVL